MSKAVSERALETAIIADLTRAGYTALCQQDLIDEHGHAVLVMAAGDNIGDRLDLGMGVPHGDTQAGVADHRDVIGVISHCADLTRLDAP